MPYMVIEDCEERYAPPELPVLRIDIIGDETFLEIAEVVEDNAHHDLLTKYLVRVKTRDLLNAIVTLEEMRLK